MSFVVRLIVVLIIWAPVLMAGAAWSVASCGGVALVGGMASPHCIVPATPALPVYAILRSIDFGLALPFTDVILWDAKALGLALAGLAALAPLALALPDWRRVPGLAWIVLLAGLVGVIAALGWLGAQSPTRAVIQNGKLALFAYFALTLAPALFARGRRGERAKRRAG